jgi:hypothetical protein
MRVLLGVLLLVLAIFTCCKSVGSHFQTKKQRAREAIEALEASCRKAEVERQGVPAYLREQRFSAWNHVDQLDYEDQPVYRRRLNDAWEGCAYFNAYRIVRRTLEPHGHPLTEEEIRHLSHKETIEVEAAYEALDETKDRKKSWNEYPYPDD